jgi:hypothetical protein
MLPDGHDRHQCHRHGEKRSGRTGVNKSREKETFFMGVNIQGNGAKEILQNIFLWR